MKNVKFIKLENQIKRLIKLLDHNTKKHPYFVIVAMHELFRNLYDYDPYIKKQSISGYSRIYNTVINLMNFVKYSSKLGSYKKNFFQKKYDTQDLFGKLWKERFNQKKLNSKDVLEELLKRSNLGTKFLKNKKILDIGCGSGRFTLAFAKLGVKLSIGVDLGEDGIKIAKLISKKEKLKNTKFIKSDVLKLPFKDNYFDFIFCKGVLHHTGHTYKGLSELERVLKPGSKAFIYLYGQGGIFWKTRRLMRKVMKKIPYEYTIKVLDLIGMPARRTIFVDSWYVPIEDHINQKKLESWFKKNNLNYTKYNKPKKTELEFMENKERYFKEIYGNGELRYIIKKNK